MEREELVRRITGGRHELESLLKMVPAERMEEPVLTNGWSVKDLVGHFGFWEERALALFGWLNGGSEPVPAPGTATADDLNASAMARIHQSSLADLIHSEKSAYQRILDLIQTAPQPDLFDPQRYALAEGNSFVGWIEGNTYGHYEEHLPDLRGWLDQPGSIAYPVDGQVVRAYVSRPNNEAPGVVVLHAWWGLNSFFQRLCDRLAGAGFAVSAPDLYNGKVARTIPEAEKAIKSLDQNYARMAALSAVDRLHSMRGVRPGPIGVIGFSMGAAWSLVLSEARPETVGAVVLFYGTNEVDFWQARAAYLGHFAERDEWEPLAGVRQMESEMKTAGRESTYHFYPGTGHWFFEDDRPEAYNAQAAELAWTRTIEFLKTQLGK